MTREQENDSQQDEWQQTDQERKEWALLEALQEVDRAGLRDQALLLAWGCGLTTVFRKELEHAKRDS